MTNMVGTCGETDKENYSRGFGKLWNKRQQLMVKEKVQGKVTGNIRALSENDHQKHL